jgi:hypothetical protein
MADASGDASACDQYAGDITASCYSRAAIKKKGITLYATRQRANTGSITRATA